MTGEELLNKFPPRKDCKGKNGCNGKGFHVQILAVKGKMSKCKLPCKCVMKQYVKSGLKIKLIEAKNESNTSMRPVQSVEEKASSALPQG